MAFRTDFLGILLILLGIISYFATGMVSITALIPTFFGIVFVLLAWLSNYKKEWNKHVMHASALLAVIGFIGSIGGLFDLLGAVFGVGEPTASAIAKSIMALLLIIYIIYAVKSFVGARRS